MIIHDSVFPAGNEGTVNVNCEDLFLKEFGVRKVLDYDVDQTLYVKWFVNYTTDINQVNARAFRDITLEPLEERSIIREMDQRIKIYSPWLLNPQTGVPVVLEVDVADAPAEPEGDMPDREIPTGGFRDTYYWIIIHDC